MAKKQSQSNTSGYIQVINPKGYLNNREITNLSDFYLVKGSLNTLIKNAEKVMSRKGIRLKGAAKTSANGIHSKFDWKTSTGWYLNTRQWLKNLEVWYGGSWVNVATNMTGNKTNYARWFDQAEGMDTILMVEGEAAIKQWSGGIAKVNSVTANSITMQGYSSGTDFTFTSNTGAPDSIIKAGGGFISAGFQVGDIIVIAGSATNDNTYTILTVSDTVITVAAGSLTTAAAGPSVVLKWKTAGTFAEARFFKNNYGFNNTPRQANINGVPYTYTGGEITGTLTGVTPDPTAATTPITNGTTIIQTVRKFTGTDIQTNGGVAALLGFLVDLICVVNGYVFVGSTKSQLLLNSKVTNFTDFGYTPITRKPGEGNIMRLNSCPTAFIAAGNQQTQNRTTKLSIFAGTSEQYNIIFTLSGDQQSETIDIDTPQVGTNLAARSQDCVTSIRNSIIYISQEPTVEQLGHMPQGVDTPRSLPMSDSIKNDIEAYNLTNASVFYGRRDLWIALPNEGIYLRFDFTNNYWQPPQTGSFSLFSLIDGVVCAHSAFSNETYELEYGYNDLGAPITFVAAYGYNNYGSRFSLKNFDETATELYISKNTKVQKIVYFDYEGATDTRSFLIDGADQSITFMPNRPASLGSQPLGTNPLGSSTEATDETNEGYVGMGKCRVIHSTTPLDFFEEQTIFACNTLDGRFHIIGFASNVVLSENEPAFIKK